MIIHFSSGRISFDVPALLLSVDEVRKYGVKLKLMRCKKISKIETLDLWST